MWNRFRRPERNDARISGRHSVGSDRFAGESLEEPTAIVGRLEDEDYGIPLRLAPREGSCDTDFMSGNDVRRSLPRDTPAMEPLLAVSAVSKHSAH